MIIVGIAGYDRAGKSTAAEALTHGMAPGTWRIMPMAEPLKDIARAIGWQGGKSPRERRLLRLLGTECGRECIGERIWLDKWLGRTRDLMAQPDHERPIMIIADDVRFPEEAEAIRALPGGIVIRVERMEARPAWWRRVLYALGVRFVMHPSERPLPEELIDAVVENNGTLDDLKEQMMRSIR